jgi:hypothetical protein
MILLILYENPGPAGRAKSSLDPLAETFKQSASAADNNI